MVKLQPLAGREYTYEVQDTTGQCLGYLRHSTEGEFVARTLGNEIEAASIRKFISFDVATRWLQGAVNGVSPRRRRTRAMMAAALLLLLAPMAASADAPPPAPEPVPQDLQVAIYQILAEQHLIAMETQQAIDALARAQAAMQQTLLQMRTDGLVAQAAQHPRGAATP